MAKRSRTPKVSVEAVAGTAISQTVPPAATFILRIASVKVYGYGGYRVGARANVGLHDGKDRICEKIDQDGDYIRVTFADGMVEEFHRSAVSVLYERVEECPTS